MRTRFRPDIESRISLFDKIALADLPSNSALPERIRNERSYERRNPNSEKRTALVLSGLDSLTEDSKSSLIALSDTELYVKARLLFPSLINVWVRIDIVTALHYLDSNAFQECGLVAEHNHHLLNHLPLFTTVQLNFTDFSQQPIIESADTRFVPELSFELPNTSSPGDVFLGRGEQAESLGMFEQAKLLYVEAAKYDHERAYLAVLQLQQRQTAPLRSEYPEVFLFLDQGEPLRALTHLRRLAQRDERVLPILSYTLRNANCPEEGLEISNLALARDQIQPDVLANKWSYLTAVGKDVEAFHVARDHLSAFPFELLAVKNCYHSALLLQRFDDAKVLASRYRAISENIELALREEFKLAELTGSFKRSLEVFERSFSLLATPSADIITLYGEMLIECGEYQRSVEIFNKALMLEPENGRVLLGYARALARSDQENEAERFLLMCLQDESRSDPRPERIFLVSLLAEVQRRTGRPTEALNTFKQFFDGDLIQLSSVVGPIPALERIESLHESGRSNEAQVEILKLLAVWPEDPFVQELEQIINAKNV